MKASSGLLVLLGVGAALFGAVLVMLIMPSRESEFVRYGMDLPGITLLLLLRPWVTLAFPALRRQTSGLMDSGVPPT